MLTLRRRLVVVNLIVFLVTMLVLVGVLSSQILRHLYEQLDHELAAAATHIADRVTTSDGHMHARRETLRAPGDPDARWFVRLLDAQGNITDAAGDAAHAPVRPDQLNGPTRGSAVNWRGDGGPLRIFTLPVFAPLNQDGNAGGAFKLGYVQVAAEPEEALEIAAQIRRSLLIGIPLALLFAGIAGLLAARKALEPLEEMTRTAADISADSLAEQRLPIPRPKDELRALALAFNATLARLAAAFARQRRFTADASHELRTPVTAILGQAELALSRPRTPDAYQASLERIRSEAERMQSLIGRLLTLARAESGQQVLKFAPTDVSAMLATLAESVAPDSVAPDDEAPGDDGPVRVALHIPPAVTIVTDADSLTQILLNLLENAITYTEAGVVDVELTEASNDITIQVCDQGPGIAPDDLAVIFEPFYRADPSRQQHKGSVGLGLALAQELTHLIGGDIAAANRPDGGAVFTVRLPRRPAG